MNEPLATARPFRDRAWTVVRLALGVLLLTAAGLKLAGQNVSAVPQVGWYATPLVQMAAAEWEIVLGLWLLSGRYRIGAWLTSVATFLTFAGVSGYLGARGQSSCGCFGTIQASPWHAFGLDLVTVALLGLFRPDLSPVRRLTRIEGRGLVLTGVSSVLGIGGLLAALTAGATLAYGSLEAALARLRGEAITVEPTYVDFGTSESGKVVWATVEIRNWTDRPVRLIGGTSDCSCITTEALPLTLMPGQSQSIPVALKVKGNAQGTIIRTGEIWTDSDRTRKLRMTVRCRVGSMGTVPNAPANGPG